jgi:hypothetical protein
VSYTVLSVATQRSSKDSKDEWHSIRDPGRKTGSPLENRQP